MTKPSQVLQLINSVIKDYLSNNNCTGDGHGNSKGKEINVCRQKQWSYICFPYCAFLFWSINIIQNNWPLPIGAFQSQWNTINETAEQNNNNNNSWPEANQLAIHKLNHGLFNEWPEQVLNPGTSDIKALASFIITGPHCLLENKVCALWRTSSCSDK